MTNRYPPPPVGYTCNHNFLFYSKRKDTKMLKFTMDPQCQKCGHIETDIEYYKFAPMSDQYPGDFLQVKCKRCKYAFKMCTKDYGEEEDD